MLKHIKRLLGIGQAPAETAAPYKVEAPAPKAPAPKAAAKPKAAKKPVVKAKTARKPRAPKA